MTIRKTTPDDLDIVCQIYADARDFMRSSGNPDQWGGSRPARADIENDVETGKGYVCEQDGEITAVFYFNVEVEPTYGKIDGQWLNDDPYGVVHRIARSRDGSARGVAAFCLNWCLDQCRNLRIDTHRDNSPMRGLLDKLGFTYCGIVWMENGDERLAFQKTLKEQI